MNQNENEKNLERTSSNNSNFSEKSLIPNENKFEITTIDKTKIDYGQMIEAIQISENQLLKIAKFNEENATKQENLIKDQLNFFKSEKEGILEIQKLVNSQIERLEGRLKTIQKIKLSMIPDPSYINEKIKQYDMEISKFEKKLKEIENSHNEKSSKLKGIYSKMDKKILKQISSIINIPTIMQLNEIFIGLLFLKEKATKEEIKEIYKDVSKLTLLIQSLNLTTMEYPVIQKTYLSISELESTSYEPNNEIYQILISFIKIQCEIAFLKQEIIECKGNIQKFVDKKNTKENSIKNKKEEIEKIIEDKYLIDQIKHYSEINELIQGFLNKKNHEIEEVECLFANFKEKYLEEFQINLTPEEESQIYKTIN